MSVVDSSNLWGLGALLNRRWNLYGVSFLESPKNCLVMGLGRLLVQVLGQRSLPT